VNSTPVFFIILLPLAFQKMQKSFSFIQKNDFFISTLVVSISIFLQLNQRSDEGLYHKIVTVVINLVPVLI
jgi:hypothetical protein